MPSIRAQPALLLRVERIPGHLHRVPFVWPASQFPPGSLPSSCSETRLPTWLPGEEALASWSVVSLWERKKAAPSPAGRFRNLHPPLGNLGLKVVRVSGVVEWQSREKVAPRDTLVTLHPTALKTQHVALFSSSALKPGKGRAEGEACFS